MNTIKDHKITIRLNDTEKEHLEQLAVTQCMSLSQFIRHKVLEKKSNDHNPDNELKFLHKMLPILSRMIIDGYLRIHKMSEKGLQTDELSALHKKAIEQFTKLGIQVK